MNVKELKIVKAMAKSLKSHEWGLNGYDEPFCKKCDRLVFTGKFCSECGTKTVLKKDKDNTVFNELLEAYNAGRKVDD